jgi:PAS domain S-box-containing protein
MPTPVRLLLVEDSPDDAELILRALDRGGYPATATRVEDGPQMEAALARGPWDLVISDHSLPKFDSTAAIAMLRAADEEVGCIIVSGSFGEEAAVRAMRAGADDYVLKDRLTALPAAVERTLRTAETRRQRRRAEGRYRSLVENDPDGIIVVDRDGLITSVNPAFCAMTGTTEAGARGRHFSEWVHPDDAERMKAGQEMVLSQDEPLHTQVRVLAAAGVTFYAELTVARLIESGEVVGLFGIFRDITERRAMERELRRSESHLRTLVDSAPDGIFTINSNGEILTLNPALVSLLGSAVGKIGRHFRDVIHPEDLPRIHQIFARRLDGEEIAPYEVRLLRDDGTAVEVEVTAAALREGTRIVGSLGIVRDITRRKAIAKELVLREERFRQVTQATQDAVYDWDLVRDQIWWNERAATMFGAAPPNHSGLAWWESRLHPEDRARVTAGLDRAASGGEERWTDEYRFQHADGGYRYLVDMGLFIRSEDGTPVRMIGAMSDITDRRAAEDARAALQSAVEVAAREWTATFDAVPMQIVLTDEGGRIQRLNQAARVALGGSWEELLGKPIGEIERAPWPVATSLARTALLTGTSLMEQIEEPEARRTWSILAAPAMTPEGRRAIVIARDTTDFAELQRSLAHERTMSALGALVAGVAHEVRNPLFAISATLDAFEARFGKEPEFSKYTGNLRPEVQRLSALMRDLLEYGRPPALQLSTGDPAGVIREVVQRSEGVAGHRGITLSFSAPTAPVLLRHDAARLQQVVQNLLDNALVHAPASSRITVTAEVRELGGVRWYALGVEDQGPGFRPEDLPHIFEPFFSRRRGGTGLGLSIVDRLMAQHGGKVVAENALAGGARVTIYLPL